MPVLPKSVQKKAAEAEQRDEFSLLDPGPYRARLMDVKADEGPKGTYWIWEFEITDEKAQGRRQWNNTSWSDGALGMPGGVKQTFAAFGADLDTDTDDLCGSEVILNIKQRKIQEGNRKGEMTNDVSSILPLDGAVGTSGDDSDGDDGEDLF